MKTEPKLKLSDLDPSQIEGIYHFIKYYLPFKEFDFVDGRIYEKGASGSDADFTEIGVETLFVLLGAALFYTSMK